MRRSIGLTAYRSLIRQRKLSYFEPSCPRPEGELIWIHAAEAGENRPIDDLAFQILQIRGHCNVLVTTPYDPTQILINNDTILDIIPGEHPLENRCIHQALETRCSYLGLGGVTTKLNSICSRKWSPYDADRCSRRWF